jgi:hypothetical protein
MVRMVRFPAGPGCRVIASISWVVVTEKGGPTRESGTNDAMSDGIEISRRPPASDKVVAPERDPRTGRIGSSDRSGKDRHDPGHRRRRRSLRSAKVLVPVGVTLAGLLIATGAILAARGGDDPQTAAPPAETSPTTSAAPAVVPVPVTTPATTEAATTTTTTVAAPEPVCSVTVVEGAATTQSDGDTSPSPLAADSSLAPGGTIATNAIGLAQIENAGGALTRLDSSSTSTCVDDGVLGLTDGRAWSRTRDEPLTIELANRSVEIDPESAVAVDCDVDPQCSVVVVQGAVTLTGSGPEVSLDAPRSIVLDPVRAVESASETVVPFDGAFGDPWMADNAERDAELGFDDAATIYSALGPAYASLAGAYNGQRTIIAAACTDGPCDIGRSVGDVADRTYTFDVDCTGSLCVGEAIVEYTVADVDKVANVPLAFDGSTYTWTVETPSFQCSYDDDGNGSFETLLGDLDLTIVYTLTPEAAEIRGDQYVMTGVRVLAVADNVIVNPHPRCAAYGPSTNTGEFVGTR